MGRGGETDRQTETERDRDSQKVRGEESLGVYKANMVLNVHRNYKAY